MGKDNSLRNIKLVFLFGVGLLVLFVLYLNIKSGDNLQTEDRIGADDEEVSEVVDDLDIDDIEKKYKESKEKEEPIEELDSSEEDFPEDEQSNYQDLTEDEIGYEDEVVDFKEQIIDIVGSKKEYKKIMSKSKKVVKYISDDESIDEWKKISTNSFIEGMEQGDYDEIISLEVVDYEIYPDEQFGDEKVIVSSILDIGESTKYVAIIFAKENKEFLLDELVLMPEYN